MSQKWREAAKLYQAENEKRQKKLEEVTRKELGARRQEEEKQARTLQAECDLTTFLDDEEGREAMQLLAQAGPLEIARDRSGCSEHPDHYYCLSGSGLVLVVDGHVSKRSPPSTKEVIRYALSDENKGIGDPSNFMPWLRRQLDLIAERAPSPSEQ